MIVPVVMLQYNVAAQTTGLPVVYNWMFTRKNIYKALLIFGCVKAG